MTRPIARGIPLAGATHDRTLLKRLHRYRLPSGEFVAADILFDGSAKTGWFLAGDTRFFFVRLDGVVLERLPGKKPGGPYRCVRRRIDPAALEDLGEQTRCDQCDWGYTPCIHRGDGAVAERLS